MRLPLVASLMISAVLSGTSETPGSKPCSAEEVLATIGQMIEARNFARAEEVSITLDDLSEIRGQKAAVRAEEAAEFDKQMVEDLAKVLRRRLQKHRDLKFDTAIVGEPTEHDWVENIAPDVATIRSSKMIFKNRRGRKVQLEISVLVRANTCWKVLLP